jgi:hypothetical protein
MRPSPAYRCRTLRWDVIIDEEGDACNQMAFEGVSFRNAAAREISLPVAEVQSGHMSPYTLLHDPRCTSEGVSSHVDWIDQRHARVSIRFEHPATSTNPVAFCLRNYDFNVYSMSLEEYRQKASYREDGVDYAEKYIDVPVGHFSLMIRFPAQICFAQTPSFAVYRLKEAEEIRDEKLTRSVQEHSYYSPLLNTAILEIADPPLGCAYRISWHLREADQICQANCGPAQTAAPVCAQAAQDSGAAEP